MSGSSLVRLVVLAGLWGSSYLFMEVALGGLRPAHIVLWRLVTGTGVLLAIALARRQPLPRAAVLWGHLCLMGIVANLAPFFLFAWGQQHITSGMAGVLNGTTPLFTLAIAAAALEEERWLPHRVAGLVLGFAGVTLVAAPWETDGVNALSGQLACLGAAACYGVAFVYTRRFLANRGLPPLALSAAQLLTATLLLGAATPVLARQPMALTLPVVASATALGAAGTGLAYLLYYRLIADAGATSTSMVTYLIPVVAVVLGVVVLGEPVRWYLFAGAAVVILGVAVAEGRVPLRPAVDAPVMSEPQETTCS